MLLNNILNYRNIMFLIVIIPILQVSACQAFLSGMLRSSGYSNTHQNQYSEGPNENWNMVINKNSDNE